MSLGKSEGISTGTKTPYGFTFALATITLVSARPGAVLLGRPRPMYYRFISVVGRWH